MKIGLYTSFIERDALTLIQETVEATRNGTIPNTEVDFIFSNKEPKDSPVTSGLLSDAVGLGIPIFTFSAPQFKPDMRAEGRVQEKKGDTALIDRWRDEFGKEVRRKTPDIDLGVLMGDMFIWGRSLCEVPAVNLHPATPDGPKGEWYNVNWELIKEGASEHGVMMHRVTPELDRGPVVAFCRFPIQTLDMMPLWDTLPSDPEARQSVIDEERKKKNESTHPLFREIRDRGFVRETPLIHSTIRSFAEGNIRFEGDALVDQSGRKLEGGYDLTGQIDQVVRFGIEGNFQRKEAR